MGGRHGALQIQPSIEIRIVAMYDLVNEWRHMNAFLVGVSSLASQATGLYPMPKEKLATLARQ
jgi:hypothetical protein